MGGPPHAIKQMVTRPNSAKKNTTSFWGCRAQPDPRSLEPCVEADGDDIMMESRDDDDVHETSRPLKQWDQEIATRTAIGAVHVSAGQGDLTFKNGRKARAVSL